MPSFQDLCLVEPRLAGLAELIESLKPEQENTSLLWHGNAHVPGIKDSLLGLAGYEAANPKLRTSEAYDVAYDHLFSLLQERLINPQKE
jgi:hypothetical protein